MPPQQRDVGELTTNGLRRVDSEGSDMSELNSDRPVYRLRRSRLIGMINWGLVISKNMPRIMMFGVVVLFAQIVHQVVTERELQNLEWTTETVSTVLVAVKELFVSLYASIMESRGFDLFSPAVKGTALVLFLAAWWMRRQTPVYLLSFATFKAPDSWRMSHDQIIEIMRRQRCFTQESLDFMGKILDRSATGQATAWPPGITKCLKDENTKADRSIEASREEAQTVIFEVVKNALAKAKVNPKEIDILVINCSLFSPTPSLCAMVLSHFGMRSDVATYNLSGMGCSASLISVDLAKSLLQTRPNAKALVVSTEIISAALYHGQDRGFLIQNTLFRCGGAAIVLSNSWADGRRAWYKLLHTVRVQGTTDSAIQCVYETHDKEGQQGVRLSKDIVKVAGKCMEKNFTVLGPSVLPIGEQAKVAFSVVARFLAKKIYGKENVTMKPYVPDFKRGIDHFCIHAGGRAVIDGIEKTLELEKYHTEASRFALLNYGNTSSSSIWYELEYIQEHQTSNPLKKGDRVLQVAFGSGFKCTSGVWLKL